MATESCSEGILLGAAFIKLIGNTGVFVQRQDDKASPKGHRMVPE
jgi:hypothetical protein